MKLTYSESPYPPCSGRLLTQSCRLLVEGPYPGAFPKTWIASAWSGFVLIGWEVGLTIALARSNLLKLLENRFGIKEVQ